MKSVILFAALLFITSLCFAQDREAIVKVLNDQRIAWNKGDIEGYMAGYWKSDSLVFVGKSAPVYGWQQTLDRYKKSYHGKEGMGELTFDLIQIKVLDSHNAFVLGGWHLKLANGAPGGYFTLWLKKINGEWRIVCDHTS